MVTEEDVRRICLSLSRNNHEVLYERLPGFRVKKKLFARIRENPLRPLRSYRPSVEDKQAMIAAEPEKYFQTPHYEGHASVLVHLEAINLTELETLLTESWLLNAPAKLAAKFEGKRSLS